MELTPLGAWIAEWGTSLDWEAKAKLREVVRETLKDYSSLIQAKNENRLVMLPSKSEEIIRIVEVALRLKLYDWQKAYITGAADYVMPGRQSGATTAYMIKLCLSDGESIYLTTLNEIDRYADGNYGPSYSDWLKNNLWDVYCKLKRIGGLKLRKIYFHKREVANDAQKNSRI